MCEPYSYEEIMADREAREQERKKNRPTWEIVIEDMRARDAIGTHKYGVPLRPHNGRNSLQDAYEEALDLAVYLKNAIIEADKGVS